MYTPTVDPRKIQLEMDYVDKSKLVEEDKLRKKEQVGFQKDKKAETNTYGAMDQIEIIRRQLVLGSMGIEIPTTIKGDIDVPKLFSIQIKKDSEKEG